MRAPLREEPDVRQPLLPGPEAGLGGARHLQVKGLPTHFSELERVGLVAIPTIVFVAVCQLFALVHHREPWVVPVVAAGGLLALAFELRRPGARQEHPWRAYVALWCLLGLCGSWLVGLLTYQHVLSRYWFSYDSNSYTNVLPSAEAAGFADAGKLLFADEARIDTNRAVGFKDGAVYCVAPIRDESPLDSVHFWAVGVDCCSPRGGFSCDDAWDPKAHAGMVVGSFENLQLDWHPQYLLAVKQAEAVYDITSSEAIFVRWVVNPEKVENNLWHLAMGIFLIATILQAMAASTFALFVNSWLREKAQQHYGVVY